MDFEAELKKLLDEEKTPVLDPLAELAKAQVKTLADINRRGNDISLQVEEIYDIVKDADENARELKSAAKRENLLLNGLVSMDDLLDNILEYLMSHGSDNAEAIAAQREAVLTSSGVERLGIPGERLDPRIHTVVSAEFCDAPPEAVIRVLESGYAYRGKVVRKAAVVLSKGRENP